MASGRRREHEGDAAQSAEDQAARPLGTSARSRVFAGRRDAARRLPAETRARRIAPTRRAPAGPPRGGPRDPRAGRAPRSPSSATAVARTRPGFERSMKTLATPARQGRRDRRVLDVLPVAHEVGEARGIPVRGHEVGDGRADRHGRRRWVRPPLSFQVGFGEGSRDGPGHPCDFGAGEALVDFAPRPRSSSRPPAAANQHRRPRARG